jgi:hypothetical protein
VKTLSQAQNCSVGGPWQNVPGTVYYQFFCSRQGSDGNVVISFWDKRLNENQQNIPPFSQPAGRGSLVTLDPKDSKTSFIITVQKGNQPNTFAVTFDQAPQSSPPTAAINKTS